jgi:arsenite-transporting ATPase
MSLILTFLGKANSGCTTVAIAAAHRLARGGSRVLLVGQDPSPAWTLQLGISASTSPQEIAANLAVVQLQTTQLLERSWEDVKEIEKQYLRSPTLKSVYPQELGILPGMDSALALNALREYDKSGLYDVIVYDSLGDLSTLRMFAIPEVLSWYLRRFGQVFNDSDLGKVISPFVQPIAAALLNTSWNPEELSAKAKSNNILAAGMEALADPNRVAAYLVTSSDPVEIATAKYLWGSAQQIGLQVKGVLLQEAAEVGELAEEFAPLAVTPLPPSLQGAWQPLSDALPNFLDIQGVPAPLVIDTNARQVKVFLPGFDKKQVKLTQYGPELTIEAGSQRRNIAVPASLRGQAVTGAKFQDGYLIISF